MRIAASRPGARPGSRRAQSTPRGDVLNRGGAPDVRNSLTPTRQDIASVDLVHSRVLKLGRIEVGLGFERIEDEVSGETSNDGRAFLQWRSWY